MQEINEIKSKQIEMKCEICNKGYMIPDGIVNMTNPPSYQHQCTVCGAKATYGVRYPVTM